MTHFNYMCPPGQLRPGRGGVKMTPRLAKKLIGIEERKNVRFLSMSTFEGIPVAFRSCQY